MKHVACKILCLVATFMSISVTAEAELKTPIVIFCDFKSYQVRLDSHLRRADFFQGDKRLRFSDLDRKRLESYLPATLANKDLPGKAIQAALKVPQDQLLESLRNNWDETQTGYIISTRNIDSQMGAIAVASIDRQTIEINGEQFLYRMKWESSFWPLILGSASDGGCRVLN